jgi:phenylalanyl-tRNA synthetase alpha chain
MEIIIAEAINRINNAKTLNELEEIKLYYLGKAGVLTKIFAQIKDIPNSEKKAFGQKVNQAKAEIDEPMNLKLEELEQIAFEKKMLEERVDLSLPSRINPRGAVHPISQAIEELVTIFSRLGFSTSIGGSIETDWYNFTALNIPENHPARQMHDTFYLENNDAKQIKLLRTHTSPVQIRTMEKASPPYRFISFGRTYRADSDMTHTPMFHQIEAVMVDKNVNMGHLKYTLTEIIRLFFENDKIEMRMRPSFFPFTEPSAEIDIRMPGEEKWLEVLGSGMVHPKVLQNVNIDPNIYGGFALGLGVERLAMLKYGIKDLRQFFDADLNWLKHFGFSCFHKVSLEGGLSR